MNTAPLDPRTPVLVGAGQHLRRENPIEPVDLIVQALRLAADDAGASRLLSAIDSVRIVNMLSWRYRDPGRLVAERLQAPVRHTVYTGLGGSHPQALVNESAADILAGRCDVVAIGGAEAWRTRMALRAEGKKPDWTRQGDNVAEAEQRAAVQMQHPAELTAGADRPIYVYPLFESALARATGVNDGEHRAMIAELWARFSRVASTNPYAWTQTEYTAEQVATPSASNRVVSWPYTKLMTSNNNVEQSAAVLMCSVQVARDLKIPSDRWVFPLAGAEAADPAAIGVRERLDASPAIRYAGAAALAAAQVDADELGAIDLYSCFPSAVQVAARELQLPITDPDRELTITGGLTFAGGPWNNYSTHAIAAMVAAVRQNDQPGLVTANSGYLTKHAIGVYGPEPTTNFTSISVQRRVDAEPQVRLLDDYQGPASLEAFTVPHGRDGVPERVIASLRLSSGERVLASASDPATLAAAMDARVADSQLGSPESAATVHENLQFTLD